VAFWALWRLFFPCKTVNHIFSAVQPPNCSLSDCGLPVTTDHKSSNYTEKSTSGHKHPFSISTFLRVYQISDRIYGEASSRNVW
jgi:hypothetical protein